MAIVTVASVPTADSGMKMGPKPLDVVEGGYLKQLSFNPFDGGTFQSVGKSHEQGGMMVDSTGNGQPDAEIEGQEAIHTSPVTGDKYVAGNLTIPGTKKKFKDAFKEIGKQEAAAGKILKTADNLLKNNNPEDKYELLAHNSGDIMGWSAVRRQKKLAETKEELAMTQEAIHDLAGKLDMEPKELNKQMMKWGGKLNVKVDALPEFAPGGRLTNNEAIFKALEKHPERMKYVDWAKDAADRAEIDPGLFHRLLFRESGFNPGATSGAGARGIAQFMPATYKGAGGDPKDFDSMSDSSIKKQLNAAAWHFKELQDKNNGDPSLAAIAYNGGQGAVNYVKKATKNPDLRGEDWIAFMEQRRQTNPTSKPNAWQNQTYEYVRALTPGVVNNADFYAGKFPTGVSNNDTFQKQYYTRPEVDVPQSLTPAGNVPITQEMQPVVNNPQALAYDSQAMLDSFAYPKHTERRAPSLADSNRLGIGQFLPEIMALGDRPDNVPHQALNPHLFQPYSVSFQDRLNANTSSFRALEQNLVNNPEALAVLASQKYNADSGVMADQFRTNQAIDNEITNKNIALINQTREKNLALNDQQFVRQTQAKENTRANQRGALNSITNKIGQNRLENNQIRMQESMYNYRYNPTTGKMEYVGPNAVFNPDSTFDFDAQADPTNQYIVRSVTNKDGSVTETREAKKPAQNNRRFQGPNSRRGRGLYNYFN